MKNISCKNCSNAISKFASACPHCSHPNKQANYLPAWQVWLTFAGMGLLIWWQVNRTPGQEAVMPSAAADAALQVAAASTVNANELGFPPDKACSFLAAVPGMAVPIGNSYGPLLGPDDYSCGTRYKEVGAGLSLPNNISYYARGTPAVAKRLRILLNVNQPSSEKEARTVLAQSAQRLFRSAFGAPLPDEINRAVVDGAPGKWKHDDYVVELQKEVWPTGRGHEFNFVVRDPAFVKGN